MKKKFDTAIMENELKGSSAFFKKPSARRDKERTKQQSSQRTNVLTNERTFERTNAPHQKFRQKTRHTFDIFADQLISLREIQLNRQKVFGKKYNLGDLVQEALDMFLVKERSNETTNERTF